MAVIMRYNKYSIYIHNPLLLFYCIKILKVRFYFVSFYKHILWFINAYYSLYSCVDNNISMLVIIITISILTNDYRKMMNEIRKIDEQNREHDEQIRKHDEQKQGK